MKLTKKITSRCKRCKTNRRHKHVKGGMFRQGATKAAKKALLEILGNTPEERAKSVYDLFQAAIDGVTKETAKKGAQVASSSTRSFEDIASPQSPFHISHVKNPMTSRMSSHGRYSNENENPNYKTPKKPTPTNKPTLPLRTKHSDTPRTRFRRLSSAVVPTAENPVPIVKTLDFEV